MDAWKGIGIRLIAAVAVTIAIGISAVAVVSAQEEMISVSSASAGVGADAPVHVDSANIPDPGLGAWTIDVTFDAAVVSAVACIPDHGGVCNPAFESNVVRITGASAGGVAGDAQLGSLTFRCGAEGTSALTVSVPLLVDATIGDPQPVTAATQNGSITCSTAAPTATPSAIDDVFDCSDFLYQDIGQAILDADPSDPHGLDPDNDGIACEELPDRDAGADSLPPVGVGDGGGAITSGQIARWLMAAFAGIGLAAAGGMGMLRMRASRSGVRRR